MQRPEWPGIATSVGIILILTFSGIVLDKDVHLKEWQTLSAGIFALVAATIAYRGATASVRHNEAVAERENNRRKLALYMKIEFAFRQLSEHASALDGKFIFGSAVGDTTFRPDDFFVPEPPELEEAWQYLDLFPRNIIAEIRTVRNALRQLAPIHAHVKEIGAIRVPQNARSPVAVSQAAGLLEDIRTAAALVVSELEPLIQELAPPMDQNERIYRFYGEPPSDEGE
jgi:hypothetical protein